MLKHLMASKLELAIRIVLAVAIIGASSMIDPRPWFQFLDEWSFLGFDVVSIVFGFSAMLVLAMPLPHNLRRLEDRARREQLGMPSNKR